MQILVIIMKFWTFEDNWIGKEKTFIHKDSENPFRMIHSQKYVPEI